MVDLLKEVPGYDLGEYDLSRFCDVAVAPRVDLSEMTEAQLQDLEERADRFYMSMM